MASSFKFTEATEQTILAAIQLARDNSNSTVTPIHLAVALLNEKSTASARAGANLLTSVCSKAGVDAQILTRQLQRLLVRLPSQDPPPEEADLSPQSHKVLREAQKVAKEKNDTFISQDALVLGLLADASVLGAFKESGLTEAAVRSAVNDIRGSKHVDTKTAEQGFEALAKYAVDLTALAEEGKLDPVIGRDNEIRRVVRILSRRTKNNPVLIGPPGVGKTAIAEGLALRIVNRDVPANLLARLMSLDMGALMAGASYKGEYEQRIKDVLAEVEKAEGNVILFIDEMHLLMAGKGDNSMDAANLLKPMLARGTLRCIGATTLDEYRKYIEKDAAFERRFQQVPVNEPSVPEAISILRGIKDKYEVHHGVTITDAAIVQAATLASRYLTSRKLPDSAIDLIDEAASGVRVARDSQPELIDAFERQKLQLEVEVRALSKEKDEASKERMEKAKEEIRGIDDKLTPLRAAFDAQKQGAEQIQQLRQKIDSLKSKADRAERSYDLATAADLRHYSIPETQHQLEQMEHQKRIDDAARGDILGETDSVTVDAIAEVVARWTGVPVTRLKATEKEKLLSMENILSQEIVGQPEAIKAVSNAIRLSRSGLNSQDRPIASFLFCGPSGTGKTQLTKALARFLFDSEDALIRIDGSEYSEKHSVSRLVGAPAGYVGYEEGGQLTEFVRRKPYCVVLVDEIEKASREFTTMFLQVLDAGRLTDGQGRVVNFKNTLIIMTSNLGAVHLNEAPDGPISKQTKELVKGDIRAHFLPEFLGRIDAQIIFNKLGGDQVRQIVDVRLKELQKRIDDNNKKITLEVSPEAKDWLGAAGVSPLYGARPLASVIQQNLLIPLSRMILSEAVRDGETARVTLDARANRLVVVPNHETNQDMEIDGDDVEVEELD